MAVLFGTEMETTGTAPGRIITIISMMMMPVPGIVVIPGMVVPGVPAVIPGTVAPAPTPMIITVITPGPVVPGTVIPGIIIPGIPGPAAVVPGAVTPGIVPRQDGRRQVCDGNDCGASGRETDFGAWGHHQGVTFIENISGRLFAESKEIVHFVLNGARLGDGSGRTAVNTVVIDLSLETGHGRAGKGGKGAKRISQNSLFHCTTSFYPIKISIFVAGKPAFNNKDAISVPFVRFPQDNNKHNSAKKQIRLWQKR